MKTPKMGQFMKAARSLTSDQRVPYAFEKRIMAHLRSVRPGDFWNACSSLMWRAAISCLIITAITGAAVTFADPSRAELFATDLERTVLAPIDVDETW